MTIIYSSLVSRQDSNLTYKAGATQAHEVRTLQRAYFMTDVAEVTLDVRSSINASIENQLTSWRSSNSARVPHMLISIGFFLFLQRTHFVRPCGPSLRLFLKQNVRLIGGYIYRN
jgi:hypothetical protein